MHQTFRIFGKEKVVKNHLLQHTPGYPKFRYLFLYLWWRPLEAILARTSSSSSDSSSTKNSLLDSSLYLEPIVLDLVSSYSIGTMGYFPFVATLAFCYSVGLRTISIWIESFAFDVATTIALGFVAIEPSMRLKELDSLIESPSYFSSLEIYIGNVIFIINGTTIFINDDFGLSTRVLPTLSSFTMGIFLLFDGGEAFFLAITFCLAVDYVVPPAWTLAWAGTPKSFSWKGTLTIGRLGEGFSSLRGLFFFFEDNKFKERTPFSLIVLLGRVLTMVIYVKSQRNKEGRKREGYGKRGKGNLKELGIWGKKR